MKRPLWKGKTVRRVLELCVELDLIAGETYAALAAATDNEQLRVVFAHMAEEEQQHVDWWTDLIFAWESGLVPDIVDEHDVAMRLSEVKTDIEQTVSERFDSLSSDEMLDLASRLEFSMLDSVFGELVELMQPGSRVDVNKAYAAHVLRLVDAIERHYSRNGLARFLARVLKRAFRDQQRLASLAVRDQLTGLLNRRGLLGHLKQWISWSARYDRPLAVLLLDVDRFKNLNDALGHAAGDLALQAVAAALQETIRDSDIVGRYGGDEFLILAPETGEADLELLMERVVVKIRTTPIEIDGRPISLSVSVGGACAHGNAANVEAITAAADRSLYSAKAGGRDRAGEVASPNCVLPSYASESTAR